MRALVVAKAPVAGRVKTRLGADLGMDAAARLAAAALLDTLTTCAAAFDDCHLALDGDLDDACEADILRSALSGWVVHPQRGRGLGERLARAHADAAGPGPTVQIGMDTPQITAVGLREIAEHAATGEAVLGPATDGGWWVLATGDADAASTLTGVPMSRADTYDRTREALTDAGQSVRRWHELTDVDTTADAAAVARSITTCGSGGHFVRAWESVTR